MANRLGQFVGLIALALVLVRLGRVLEVAADAPDWRLIVPAAAIGGILLTWVGTRLPLWRRASLHLVGLTLVVIRVVAPDTLALGFLPSASTAAAMGEELSYAVELLRFGAPPVLAVAGLTALTAAAMWCLAALWAWSATGGPTWMGVLPALGFYLYLAVVDRLPSSTTWTIAFASLLAIGLVVTGDVVPSGAGRLRASDHRPLPRWRVGPALATACAVALVGVAGAAALGPAIPVGGAVDWRYPGGEGSGLGGSGFSASRFAGLRQSLISLSDEPVFVASVDPQPARGTTGYWRLLTLDRYDGQQWRTGDAQFAPIQEADPASGAVPSVPTTQTIEIRSLRDDRLPSLLTPVAIASEEAVIRSGTSLGNDGSLQVNARTFEGLTYRVESEVPQIDVGALATEDGELTPMFAEASAEGSFNETPAASPSVPRPESVSAFLTLPDSIDSTIGNIARRATQGASSTFEAALLLESFFLEGFSYSTDVTTGHSALDLAAWIDDPDSPNYRTGYCEQFATAMAIMARQLGIPSRVVIGFTSGEQTETEEGTLTVVRERNAHAWVEIWIDGHGWVGFDPTPRGDAATSPMISAVGFDPGSVELPATSDDAVSGLDQRDFIEMPLNVPMSDLIGESSGSGSETWLWWLGAAFVVLALAGAVPLLKVLRTRHRRRQAADGDISAAWREIVDRLEDLGRGPERHATPIEFAKATETTLVPFARAYSASVYGEREPSDAVAHMRSAERWIVDTFEPSRRARATFSLRSVRNGNGRWRRRETSG